MRISGEFLKVIGHRGWPTRYPDNVLAGIDAAAQVADMVEVDIRITADGVLILSHDPRLGDREVHASSWSQLEDVDLGGGHHPLTLTGLLAAFPGFPFNLELKNYPGDPGFDDSHEMAFLTADQARESDLLTCFYWPTVDALRLSHPALRTGLLIDVGGRLDDAVQHAVEVGHRAVVPHWQTALDDPTAISDAVESGLEVTVWTLNDPKIARDLAGIGVAAIITDDPGELCRALRESR
ncbi:MAG: glycerophosphodiester phosphodiesterase [Acidimicrobiia bacterium]